VLIVREFFFHQLFQSAASASFWWISLASPSCLFTYSVGAICSHVAVICWTVSGSFPHLLHSSSMFGCFKLLLLFFIILLLLLRGPG
jgi:hypothetical protein